MFRNRARRLDALLADHRTAVHEFLVRDRAIDGAHWLTPRAEGKWTPAQETQHLILAYQEFLRQLREDRPMRLREGLVGRVIARVYGLPSVLWRKRIPVAAHAPREVRPTWVDEGADVLIPRLEHLAEEFERDFRLTWFNEPKRRMSHYWFGKLSLDQGVRFVTVHTQHHAAFLPPVPSRAAQPSLHHSI
jgi:hypothetical protein